MTQEEKAKAYDKAYKKVAVRFGSNVADEIFPELKESEDERIKRAIITTIHLYYGEPLEDEAKEMIAWLEKQGERPNNVYDKEFSENLDAVIRRYINDPSIPDAVRGMVKREIIPYVERLEKQGVQNTWKPSDEQMHYLSWVANIKLGDSVVEQEVSKHLNELLEDLKKLKDEK